ncbi:hypothetical protein I4U23_010888 [Adineta vaga]|nr:hypothetical protein I4U23_010888 [Adineta vaga]
MSIMNGWQFQCATTTCLPFSTVTVSNVRQCQTKCLYYTQCKSINFQLSISRCQLFSDTLDPSTDLQASTGMITMIVKDGTRVPSGLFKYNNKD